MSFSDSDKEPIMDGIPVEVLNRLPLEYKDMLIRELKRLTDRCKYREVMRSHYFRVFL